MRARRLPAATDASRTSGVSSPARGFGARRGTLGLPMAPIGLPGTTSSATRKAKNWFHVDQARRVDAWLCPSA